MSVTIQSPKQPATDRKWASTELSDAEIIAKVLAGDDAAYEGIMRRYNRMLFRIARGIVRNDDDAMDVLQESYVKAYRALSQFNGPSGFPSWIARIVVNQALSQARKFSLPEDKSIDADETPTEILDRPEQLAMRNDTLHLIEAAIDELPADFRLVFMLRGVEQLTVRETAELLNIKQATVKTRFHRARRIMRNSLQKKLSDTVPSTFSFAGARCDGIVANVFEKVAGIQPREH